jgi:hypothetical protein
MLRVHARSGTQFTQYCGERGTGGVHRGINAPHIRAFMTADTAETRAAARDAFAATVIRPRMGAGCGSVKLSATELSELLTDRRVTEYSRTASSGSS